METLQDKEVGFVRDIFDAAEAELDVDSKGNLTAVMATLDVVNRNRRMLKAGVLGSKVATIAVSDWMHNSVSGGIFSPPTEKPVAVGQLREDGKKLIMTASYNMERDYARDSFEYIRDNKPIISFSLGYMPTKYEFLNQGGKEYMGIYQADFFEGSPLVRGLEASPGTRVLSADMTDEDLSNLLKEVGVDRVIEALKDDIVDRSSFQSACDRIVELTNKLAQGGA